MPTLDRLVVVLEGNVAQLRAALAQGDAALGKTEAAATKTKTAVAGVSKTSKEAAPNLNAFRGSVVSLATSMLRLPGPLVQITGLLGTLALGTGTTIAIIGGITAITGVINLLTKGSRESKKELEDLTERLKALREEHKLGVAGKGLLDVEAQQKVVDNLLASSGVPRLDARGGALAKWETMSGGAAKLAEARSLLAFAQAATFERMNAETAARFEKQMELANAQLEAQKRLAAKEKAVWEEYWKVRGAQLIAFVERAQQVFWNMRNTPLVPAVDRIRARTTVGLTRLPMTLTPQSRLPNAGAFTEGSSRLLDVLDGLKEGAKNFFSGLKDFRGMGAQLGGNLFGMAAGELLGSIGKLIQGQSKLAAAMEQNTQVLRATGDAIGKRLREAGLTDDIGDRLAAAVSDILDRFAFGELGEQRYVDPMLQRAFEQLEIFRALEAAGFSLQQLRAWAEAINFDLSTLSEETLAQFLEALNKAGFAADGLADSLGAATRGLPSWYRIDAARYLATAPVASGAMPGGASAARAMPAGSVTHLNGNITLEVHQLPGEDAVAFANIVLDGLGRIASSGKTTFLDARFLRRGER